MFANLKAQGLRVNHDCRLLIDAETLKPMYQAVIIVDKLGDFMGLSFISKSDALKQASLKLKEYMNQLASGVLASPSSKLSRSQTFSPSIKSNSSTNRTLTSLDFQRVKLIKQFNSGIYYQFIWFITRFIYIFSM